ncbi:MAG TPA: FMN-binding protein, partial [Candidatus Omnitrophica bacterium]|nr:FMN-binding protein [Candidatus Omnitrophota bacterium]
QNETPGLGVKIIELASQVTLIEVLTGKAKKDEKQKPWFEERFSNKKIADIDTVEAITGATISSEAVIKSVKEKAEEIISLVKYE